jgi:hypothetical protein
MAHEPISRRRILHGNSFFAASPDAPKRLVSVELFTEIDPAQAR